MQISVGPALGVGELNDPSTAAVHVDDVGSTRPPWGMNRTSGNWFAVFIDNRAVAGTLRRCERAR